MFKTINDEKLDAVNKSIEALQDLQYVHLDMGTGNDEIISRTISRLLHVRYVLIDEVEKEGNIAQRWLGVVKRNLNMKA
jgi:hypothetical protein